ncbi:TBC1 domain family member 4 isoform X2 [Lethenteron reissneri]|uniref:TBC1 domain family member 4 isoform X2 n=1 Tax=Lethenteron reissneri TaxID=7753 RepID=UPI002AB5EB5C|nr:TBC1 domain family member 4 isoform X2 [Lethenteron reissneri]
MADVVDVESHPSTSSKAVSCVAERAFSLAYLGSTALDQRATLSMLPWIVAELLRRSEKEQIEREVMLYVCPPLVRCVPAGSQSNSSIFIFEQRAAHISRFVHCSRQPGSFAYLVRTQPDNPDSHTSCHVFRAPAGQPVQEVISCIRQVGKAAIKEEGRGKPGQPAGVAAAAAPGGSSEAPPAAPATAVVPSSGVGGVGGAQDAFCNAHKFEVLYRGRVSVAHKKAPPTLVDDCIAKFSLLESTRSRLRCLDGGSGDGESNGSPAPASDGPSFIAGGGDSRRSSQGADCADGPGSQDLIGDIGEPAPLVPPATPTVSAAAAATAPSSALLSESRLSLSSSSSSPPAASAAAAGADGRCAKTSEEEEEDDDLVPDEGIVISARRSACNDNAGGNGGKAASGLSALATCDSLAFDSDPLGVGVFAAVAPTSGRSGSFSYVGGNGGGNTNDGGGSSVDLEGVPDFRGRCYSAAGSLQRKPAQASGGAGAGASACRTGRQRRRHASAPSLVQPSDADKNRTMLFQVGRFEINLISPDTKTVAIEKNFKDISSCSQGIKHVDHFGFICRESAEPGVTHYVCYVFQCASEALVDEIMLTLKQAFHTAASLQNAKTPVQLCEACPMHYLHKLCERIEGLYPPKAKLVIQKHVALLSDNEQADIFERVQRQRPTGDQDENEVVMCVLRQVCEGKQKTHTHLGDMPQQGQPTHGTGDLRSSPSQSKLDILKNKAKKSFTNSLENIFSRGGGRMRSRLGSVDNYDSLRERSLNACESTRDGSPGASPPPSPTLSPHSPPTPESPLQMRRRAHTFSHSLPQGSGTQRRITFADERAESTGQAGATTTPPPPPSSSVSASASSSSFSAAASFSASSSLSSSTAAAAAAAAAVGKSKLQRFYSFHSETHHRKGPGEGEGEGSLSGSPASPGPATLHPSPSAPGLLKYLLNSQHQQQQYQQQQPASATRSDLDWGGSGSAASLRGVWSELGGHNPPGRPSCPPVQQRRISWRQHIFLRVVAPGKSCAASRAAAAARDGSELLPLSPLTPPLEESPIGSLLDSDFQPMGDESPVMRPTAPREPPSDEPMVIETGAGDGERHARSREELRHLWRKAIDQQLLLIRVERQNRFREARRQLEQEKAQARLDYAEVTPCLRDVTVVWERLLGAPNRARVRCDMEKVHAAISQGVPRQRRGEIWQFLAEQYRLRHRLPPKQAPPDTPYPELLKRLTSQQHAILIDLGRTFPTHPYFSAQLGSGQLALYNLLKAYSLLDSEVGYCQGLSFVAGVLLLHLPECDAFHALIYLLYHLGLRRQYCPDMLSLQIQMYQLSRLLHDYHPDLYAHLEESEIGPSLYAAPWFLTLFASQFPLGFVARVFDMLFLQGTEVIFKVALSLLGSHQALIMQCDSFESIMDFLKTTLPNLGLVQMEKTINQVCEMDLSRQLHAYEVEYHVLQDEMALQEPGGPPSSTGTGAAASADAERLEKTCLSLKRHNQDLVEELQSARERIHCLEGAMERLRVSESRLRQSVNNRESERPALQAAALSSSSPTSSSTAASSSNASSSSSTSSRHAKLPGGRPNATDLGS